MPLPRLLLNDTPVQDLTPLADCPLRHLELAQTPVEDLSPLQTLNLETLDLTGSTRIRDLKPARSATTNGTLIPPEGRGTSLTGLRP